MNINIDFYLKSLIITIFILDISCYIKLEFKNELKIIEPLKENNFDFSNLIKNLLFNEIKANIYIGTPPQKIDLFLSMKKPDLIFNTQQKNVISKINIFSPNNSNTFQYLNLSGAQIVPAKDIISFDFYTFFNNNEKKFESLKKEILFYINNFTNSNIIANLGLGPNYIENDEEENNYVKVPFFISIKKAWFNIKL